MKITVFAKKRTTKQGVKFYSYLTKMVKKDGTELTASVSFPEELRPKPESCPLNIIVAKEDANLTTKNVQNEDGTIYEKRTLWVNKYELDPEKYRDKSLDDFE